MVAHPPSKRVLRASSPCASSGQATPRHMEWPAYRCFLPDLTGFAGFHCVGPDLQRRDTADSLAERPLGRGFSPAVADCGYRAPLAPRLARPWSRLPARPGGSKRAMRRRAQRMPPGRPATLPAPSCKPRHPPATVRTVAAVKTTCSPRSSSRVVVLAVVWPSRRWARRGRAASAPGGRSSRRRAPWTCCASSPAAAAPRRLAARGPRARASSTSGCAGLGRSTRTCRPPRWCRAREPRVAGTVHNVVARLPGPRPSRAVLLVAHYDSVPDGRRRRRRRQRRRRRCSRRRARCAPARRRATTSSSCSPTARSAACSGSQAFLARRPLGLRRRRRAQLRQPGLVVAGADVRDEPGQRPAGARTSSPPAAPTARRSCTRSRAASPSSATSGRSWPRGIPGHDASACSTARPTTTRPTTRSRRSTRPGCSTRATPPSRWPAASATPTSGTCTRPTSCTST